MNRRQFIALSGAAFGCSLAGGLGMAAVQRPKRAHLRLQIAGYRLRNGITPNLVSLSPDGPPPVLVAEQGKSAVFTVENGLDEYTSMHWHGIRLPNAMDGVPYLTQLPIAGGEVFEYQFTPPDAGTYWYHPHCMTMTQMARGLTGVLIVKETTDPGFDADQAINLRDFRLDKNDRLRTSFSPRKAARSGTLGNVITANWATNPVYDHPAGGLTRLRLVNTDTTRIYRLYLAGGASEIVAWDGHPVETGLPVPSQDTPLLLGPGQRVDIALVMPSAEGQVVTLNAMLAGQPRPMATLRAVGSNLARSLADLQPLAPNPVKRPVLSEAQTHEFVFGWSPDGTAPNNGFCGSLGSNFWSINRVAWSGDAASSTGPLATLDLGKSYIFRFRNESPNLHPIHLHGLTFIPLRSNKRKLARNWTDTALLLKDEVMDVALVADNPGDWAFHCHVIEHQKTGLAGVIRVT
ncbi:MAG: multicopper oxidase family protein [Pseudomonadota bacterium]